MKTRLIISTILLLAGAPTRGQDFDAKAHPPFPLLDAEGSNVLHSARPVSTMQTCSGCHHTGYIAAHSAHANLGMDRAGAAGSLPGGRPWEFGPGAFGRWDPLTYRRLTLEEDEPFDLAVADFIRSFGSRHVGGGMAEVSRDGPSLEALKPGAIETQATDPDTGEKITWDWEKSGTIEMNCFLCHIPSPNNAARIAEIEAGRFRWANTATLLGKGIVTRDTAGSTWTWDKQAFDAQGRLREPYNQMAPPRSTHCGQCHGFVQGDPSQLLNLDRLDATQWNSLMTGEVFAPTRIADSGLNVAGKEACVRSFDIHSERLVGCTECHHAINNPIYHRASPASAPPHLRFDPRRMDLREYLYRPNHNLAAGLQCTAVGRTRFDQPMRGCVDCHNPAAGHDWLPYAAGHFDALSCTACHIPKLYAPALRMIDWTLPGPEMTPRTEHRGIAGEPDTVNRLIEGFTPALLLCNKEAGHPRLTPFNLITSYYWVAGNPERPVRIADLKRALLRDGKHHPELLALLDRDGDGQLNPAERQLDTLEKQALVQQRLAAIGLVNPRIHAEVEPHAIHHGVVGQAGALRDCSSCHSSDSRLYRPVKLAQTGPVGKEPVWVAPPLLGVPGEMVLADDGALTFQLTPRSGGLFILGHDAAGWAQVIGAGSFLLMLLGITLHGGLRYLSHRRRPQAKAHSGLKRTYLYTSYQRFWHWLQAATIVGLIISGLVIHDPKTWGAFDFALMVQAHNILGFILLFNALFSAVYHFSSEKIRHYLPEPQGFFSQIIEQVHYYLYGIFHGEPHPFEKTADKKLNPLQRITYLMILNILLPLQIITGVLTWGAQRWPLLTERLGGLPLLVPVHSLGAWLFAGFLIVHIYLTTTGHSLTSNLKAMVTGWEDLATHKTDSAS